MAQGQIRVAQQGLNNCSRCSEPYHRTGNLSLCPKCLRHETQLFESYYFKVLRHLSNLDIPKVVKRTQLDANRLADALNFRLGLGKVFHLTCWKPGNCYVCRGRHSHSECREPICIDCLDVFIRAVKGDYRDVEEALAEETPIPPRPKLSGNRPPAPLSTHLATPSAVPRPEPEIILPPRPKALPVIEPYEAPLVKDDDIAADTAMLPADAVELKPSTTSSKPLSLPEAPPVPSVRAGVQPKFSSGEERQLQARLVETQQQVAALQHELDRYRHHFGDLPPRAMRTGPEPAAVLPEVIAPLITLLNEPDDHFQLSVSDWAEMEAELALPPRRLTDPLPPKSLAFKRG